MGDSAYDMMQHEDAVPSKLSPGGSKKKSPPASDSLFPNNDCDAPNAFASNGFSDFSVGRFCHWVVINVDCVGHCFGTGTDTGSTILLLHDGLLGCSTGALQ